MLYRPLRKRSRYSSRMAFHPPGAASLMPAYKNCSPQAYDCRHRCPRDFLAQLLELTWLAQKVFTGGASKANQSTKDSESLKSVHRHPLVVQHSSLQSSFDFFM